MIKALIFSPKWSEVHVIVRRTLPDWKKLDSNILFFEYFFLKYIKGNKLKIIEVSSLDLLQQPENWVKFENFHSFFCTLGSRVKNGNVRIFL